MAKVAISYTPVSGIIDTLHFLHKWIFKRRIVHRTISRVKNERTTRLRSRARASARRAVKRQPRA